MNMCDCDCEMPEFLNMRIVTAKKSHKCCECFGPIEAGQKYEYISGRWDGDFDVFKTCMRCSELRKEITKKGSCVCFEGLMENIEESGEELPKDYIERREALIKERRAKAALSAVMEEKV